MKISLVITTQGKWQGKVFLIPHSGFTIGRDPECQLRPASPLISKKHCAIQVTEKKVFAKDFNTTNGSFLNGRQFKGEVELLHEDLLRMGPLEFKVCIEATPSVTKASPKPAKGSEDTADDTAAAMLMATETETTPPAQREVEEIPLGDTAMDMAIPPELKEKPAAPTGKAPAKAKADQGDTSSAAKNILDKYLRRSR